MVMRRTCLIGLVGTLLFCHGLQAQVILLVTDTFNNNVLRFTGLAAGSSPTVFQNGLAGGVNMTLPAGLAQDAAGNVYVSAVQNTNLPNGQILRFNGTTGTYIDRFVSPGTFGNPNNITFGPGGDLFVADPTGNGSTGNVVRRYAAATGAPVGTNGIFVSQGSGGLALPYDVTWNSNQSFFFATSFNSDAILRYNPDGSFNSSFASGANVSSPTGMIFGPDGNLYVSMTSGTNANRVNRFNGTTGAFIDSFVAAGSGGLDGPSGLAFGPDGNLYVASQNTGSILRYNGTTGAFVDTYATDLSFPQELLFLSSAVPEPTTWALMVVSFAGMGAYYGFRKKPVKQQPTEEAVPSEPTLVEAAH